MPKQRHEIIGNARRIRDAIELDFATLDHWNRNVRKPGEEPIDMDPDGELRRLADGITRMLRDDKGSGPIPSFMEFM